MHLLPGVTIFERGWLSANNILLTDERVAAVVDTGYWSHSPQTVGLIRQKLGDRPLDLILNTHLHSDHCGGNAALQEAYPRVQTRIPPGLATAVRDWDPVALSYTPTGQHCPPFKMDGTMNPGSSLLLGGRTWQVHAAPGHDANSVILFDAESRTLISADALWENGFGVVFQELEGIQAFDEVAQTLDLIERLAPLQVIPGHGGSFSNVSQALKRARQRLDAYLADPVRHASHGAKVLIKFKLLEVQSLSLTEFRSWVADTKYFGLVHTRYFQGVDFNRWVDDLLASLAGSGAARLTENAILNT